jgi:hypothetical protein
MWEVAKDGVGVGFEDNMVWGQASGWRLCRNEGVEIMSRWAKGLKAEFWSDLKFG